MQTAHQYLIAYLTLFAVLLVTGCRPDNEVLESAADNIERPTDILTPDKVIGKWSFSSHWSGGMGMAMELSEDRTFKYWFYSDVSLDQEYPIEGSWRIEDELLKLTPKNEVHLYSEVWTWADLPEVSGLIKPTDLSGSHAPETRMLFKNDDHRYEWPVMNMPRNIDLDEVIRKYKAQQDEASDS